MATKQNSSIKAVYVKSATFGSLGTKFYVGFAPSDPTRGPCDRLGQYFIVTQSLESAHGIADSVAFDYGVPVIECPHYVAF